MNYNVHAHLALSIFFFFSQVLTFLKSWGKPALQYQYGRDFHFTSLWNTTMTMVNEGLVEEHLSLWCRHYYRDLITK